MTSQDKKAYLERYRESDQEIDHLCEELSRWRGRAIRITSDLSHDPLESREEERQSKLAVEQIVSLEGQINAKIDDALRIKHQVEDAIRTVKEGVLREVLTQRYILCKRWEQIAVDMNYGYRWVLRLHGKALKLVEVE